MPAKTYVVTVAGDTPKQLLKDINALEMRAIELHLFPCSRALNNAKNAAGWQLAGDISAADAASTYRA